MRTLPADIEAKLKQRIQTIDNNSAITSSIWINRPTTQLTEDTFLEEQSTPIGVATSADIAVSHPRSGVDIDRTYVAYVTGGVIKVVTSIPKVKIDSHIWETNDFTQSGRLVSIAFDGTMPRIGTSQDVEFVTKGEPYIFYTSETNQLFVRRFDEEESILLVETGVTAISSVRASWSLAFDFGLIIFFIQNGAIWYMQLIDGVWYEPVSVTLGPTGTTWTDITASRTWDYRVIIQVMSSTGVMYEFGTQFMGIGRHSEEHISVTDVKAESKLTPIVRTSRSVEEHITVSDVKAVGNAWSIFVPEFVTAMNINDGNDDWGRFAVVKLNAQLPLEGVVQNLSSFSIVDSRGMVYIPSGATRGSSMYELIFEFTNFNNARGNCSFKYTAGTVTSMADIVMETTSIPFTPINLIPSEIPVPKVKRAINL